MIFRVCADCSNGVAVKATNEVYCLAPHLFSQSLTAQRICAISLDTDKNSSHSFAKLSAWWVRTLCASGKFERRYGRDALNNTFGECVVAKANEADCLANAEVQTRKEGGSFYFKCFVEK